MRSRHRPGPGQQQSLQCHSSLVEQLPPLLRVTIDCAAGLYGYSALLDLDTQVLDPVIDWFGMIRLTYGFCSPELARAIPGRIDPKLDQHAAHERNRRGLPVCPRPGAAVDLIVDDEDMPEVARWVAANTAFDRLYYYGQDLPHPCELRAGPQPPNGEDAPHCHRAFGAAGGY